MIISNVILISKRQTGVLFHLARHRALTPALLADQLGWFSCEGLYLPFKQNRNHTICCWPLTKSLVRTNTCNCSYRSFCSCIGNIPNCNKTKTFSRSLLPSTNDSSCSWKQMLAFDTNWRGWLGSIFVDMRSNPSGYKAQWKEVPSPCRYQVSLASETLQVKQILLFCCNFLPLRFLSASAQNTLMSH